MKRNIPANIHRREIIFVLFALFEYSSSKLFCHFSSNKSYFDWSSFFSFFSFLWARAYLFACSSFIETCLLSLSFSTSNSEILSELQCPLSDLFLSLPAILWFPPIPDFPQYSAIVSKSRKTFPSLFSITSFSQSFWR